jgi:hypothetical protein
MPRKHSGRGLCLIASALLFAAVTAHASPTVIRIDGWSVSLFFDDGRVVRAGYFSPGGGTSPAVIDFGEVRVGATRTVKMAVCISNGGDGGTSGLTFGSGSTHFLLPFRSWSDPEFPPPYCRLIPLLFAPRVGGTFEATYTAIGTSDYIGTRSHTFRIVGRGRW